MQSRLRNFLYSFININDMSMKRHLTFKSCLKGIDFCVKRYFHVIFAAFNYSKCVAKRKKISLVYILSSLFTWMKIVASHHMKCWRWSLAYFSENLTLFLHKINVSEFVTKLITLLFDDFFLLSTKNVFWRITFSPLSNRKSIVINFDFWHYLWNDKITIYIE